MAEEIKKKNDTKVEETPSDTVTVDRAMLENILAEVKVIRDKNEKLETTNKMLVEVADKGRVANYQQKNNPASLVRTARAWIWDGKVVKATLTLRNEAYYDSFNRAYTDQVLKVILEDGSEVETTYEDFSKRKTFKTGEIISKETSDKGEFYKLKFEDGQELPINIYFLN